VSGVVSIPFPATLFDAARPPASRAVAGSRELSQPRDSRRLSEFVVGPENLLVPWIVEACLRTREALDAPPAPKPRNANSNIAIRTPEAVKASDEDTLLEGLERFLPAGGTSLSPLVIVGPPGSGKTHLALGLCQTWRERWPNDTVFYASSADLARQLNEAVEQRTTHAWRKACRASRLFVIENLMAHSAQGREQGELVRLLDDLADTDAQVILTLRCSLDKLPNLSPVLATRLEAGLRVDLAAPGIEARRALLERLTKLRQTPITADALAALTEGAVGSVPELFGTLLSVETEALLDGERVELTHVEQVLTRRRLARSPSLRGIAVSTARHYALKLPDLKSASRRRSVVTARGVAMYLARQLTGKSLEQIGRYFGGRDHTTVLHGCRKTESLIRNDPDTWQAVEQLRTTLAPN